ncbi:hypothetical protein SEA_CECE_231 [Microbacterium phage Cece]|nr:hypothetical protein SEA_CECE_231 [Microbacterium phage Cece]
MTNEPKRLVVADEVSGPRPPLRFEPGHVLYISTGQRPTINSKGDSFWRRLEPKDLDND